MQEHAGGGAVAGWRGGSAFEKRGRDVAASAGDFSNAQRVIRIVWPRQAEVGDGNLRVLSSLLENNVTGLEVAVDHARRGRRIQARCQLTYNRQDGLGRHGTQPAQARGQRFAAEQLHRQAEDGTARPFQTEQIVSGTDVPVIHFAREQNFGSKRARISTSSAISARRVFSAMCLVWRCSSTAS